ncbi:MAG: DNA polymerase III subunit delta' [Gallionella sp.]
MSSIYPWQANDWSRLQALRQRLPNGLLFKGAKGIGKFELAMTFAKSLLCQKPDEHHFSCGECPSCHWFEQGTHPDFRLLQSELESLDGEETESGKKPSKQISVEQVRALSDFVGMSAHQGGRRIIVIHPAETMNTNSANALLKSLEEPPKDLLFILVSHKPQQLLPTILSRCLSFTLPAPDNDKVIQWLKQQGVNNPIGMLASSGYSPLQAAQMAEQSCKEEREKLLQALRQPSGLDVFSLAETLQKTEQVLVVQWLQQWSYDLSAMKLAGKLRYHLGDEALIRKLVAPITLLNLARLQKLLVTAKREAQHTLNPKLFFESLLLNYCQLMQE